MQSKVALHFQHPELENPALTHINRLPPRSNLIPAHESGIYYKNKEASHLLQSLCGSYKFKYCECDCIQDFFIMDYDDRNWDNIDVPSMWQYRGYGKCCYPNTNYPIPFNPPYVSCPNPVGYYRCTFSACPRERTILHFGGVDNAFYVYLNGEFVGFSKGSRIPAEFDVSHLIREGKNLIAVKVFTYSDATYLEGQDMLLANGIFRDVYLLHTEKISLWDYRVTTDLKGFQLHLELTECSPEYMVEIQIGDNFRIFSADKIIDTYFPIENPRLWNNEEPNLYSMVIRIKKNYEVREVHSKKIGMLHSCIVGKHLLVNGKPVYIKGINRHEYDCDNGRAISVALIEKELKMIKANNINAIRCSHYTNHPAFYEICSELGIFVMDEADLETHGCSVTSDQGYLSKCSEWLPAYLDRVERMLKQNKNEVCIFMYSMGNECGQGENMLECLKYALAYEPNKVSIHDQQTTRDELFCQPCGKYDFIKRAGYLSADHLQKLIDAQSVSMQIEYAHAMGNSPGFLEGYQKFVYENDNYLGGFVWEFKNHGFHQVDERNNDYYLYGGDFGDKNHQANFCLDGYLMSDGTPKHTWYELGEVFAPVYVTYDGQIHLKNTFNFRNLNTLTLNWEILEDFRYVKGGSLRLPSVAPHEETILNIDIAPDHYQPGAAYYLNLSFYDGTILTGSHQIKLPVSIAPKAYIASEFEGEIIMEDQIFTVFGKDFTVSFEKGILCNYTLHEKTLIDQTFTFNLYRAPTDNDGIVCMQNPAFHRSALAWNNACLDTIRFVPSDFYGERLSDMVICRATGKVLPLAKYYGFDVEIEYHIYNNGLISISMKATPYGNFPETLPRIGLCFPINQEYRQTTWYGRGPRENYCDCKKVSPVGLYSKPIQETYTIFDMPQESGNHENTSFVMLNSPQGNGLAVIGCSEFAFSYHDFTLTNLTKALHKNELEKDNYNYLYIDYKMRGLGNHSCGPDPEEPYELKPHAFTFSFVLYGDISLSQALNLKRTDFGISTGPLNSTTFFQSSSSEQETALL